MNRGVPSVFRVDELLVIETVSFDDPAFLHNLHDNIAHSYYLQDIQYSLLVL
jgi:hypothetical protein